MLARMSLAANALRRLVALALGFVASASVAEHAAAQEVPRVSVSRGLRVGGLVSDPHVEDLLGLGRVKFHGVIAAELSAVGYRLADGGDPPASNGAEEGRPPLNLVGYVREEICDDEGPSQCRIAIQWELQDERGVTVYRAITRAVDQAPTLDKLRRGLVEGALRSLSLRRRFALQLSDSRAVTRASVVGPLGFKQCRRPRLVLPQAARAAAASLVFVEAGSSLTSGAVVSGDGLILTNARTLDERAPLRVRFSAEQTLPAKIVALDRAADVALLHVAARTDSTCLSLRDAPLREGVATFGISSELSEDRAFSLAGSVVRRTEAAGELQLLDVDPLIARAEGGPLLDDQGQLAGVVSAPQSSKGGGPRALTVSSALAVLQLKPAAITDPRLLEHDGEAAPATSYVRDHDDPPFVLTKRYTYGTSTTAHRIRKAGLVAAGIGGVTVAGTWLSFRATAHPSASEHRRAVVLNDIGWTLLGLGAVGFGASFALPEGHDVVAVQSASRRRLFVGVGSSGIQLSGQL